MPCEFNRRQMVRSLLLGIGHLPGRAAATCMAAGGLAARARKRRTFRGTAKRVIFIYLSGGASHVDSFDPKPKLAEYQREGKTGENNRKMLGSPWAHKPRGQSRHRSHRPVPEYRRVRGRSLRDPLACAAITTITSRPRSASTPARTFKRPSVGSWVTYGLGTENQNLPCFVVLAPEMPYAGSQIWSSDFLPGVYSGTRITSGPEPVPDLNRRAPSAEMQKLELSSARSLQSQARAAASRRPDARRAHQELRDRVRHADDDAAGARSLQGDRRHAEALRHGARHDDGLRLAVPRGAPHDGAGRALRRTDRRGHRARTGTRTATFTRMRRWPRISTSRSRGC